MKYPITTSRRGAIHALVILAACSFSNSTMAASVSSLLISEVMANPSAVSDSNGEWFELFNPTHQRIDLNGVTLSDQGSDIHLISASGTLFIDPGSYFVLARNGDMMSNGGFQADYVYGSDFALTNTEDEIILTDNNGNSLSLAYGSGFISAGISRELASEQMLTDHYINSSQTFGDGDLGTPGFQGGYDFTPSPVPVPAAFWLMTSGLGSGLLLMRRKSLGRQSTT